MKKFKFKLETPLKIKKINEEIRKQKLAEAINIKNKEENRLKALIRIDSDIKSELKYSLQESLKAKDLSLLATYMSHIKSDIHAQEITFKNAMMAYEKTRLSFIDIKKERQIFEKIRENKLNSYFKEINLEEQKITDEAAANRHGFLRRQSDGYVE